MEKGSEGAGFSGGTEGWWKKERVAEGEDGVGEGREWGSAGREEGREERRVLGALPQQAAKLLLR